MDILKLTTNPKPGKILEFLKTASKDKVRSLLHGVTGMTRPVSVKECGAGSSLHSDTALVDRYGVPLYLSIGNGGACRKIMLRWIYEIMRLYKGQYGIEKHDE